jgi:hypothetical protein
VTTPRQYLPGAIKEALTIPGRICRQGRRGQEGTDFVRIEGSYRYAAPTRANGRATGAGFRIEDGAATREARGAGAAAETPAIDALLALQAVEDPLLSRKKTIRRGRALLDVLDEIKADLLSGRVGEGRLNALIALLGQARDASDPRLEALIEDIELRARVELAKLGRYPAA